MTLEATPALPPGEEDDGFLAFLRHRYVVHADERQRAMGLSYLTAETRDLAKTASLFYAARIRALTAEVERLRRDCSELYQVLGTMAEHCPDPDDPAIVKALDNASDAAAGDPRRHDDLLPFILPKAERDALRSQLESALAALKEVAESRMPGYSRKIAIEALAALTTEKSESDA